MFHRRQLALCSIAVLALSAGAVVYVQRGDAEETAVAAVTAAKFARTTIDVGVVVSDIDQAVAFYTTAIGFTENRGFGVPGPFSADVGLTDGAPLDIKVLTLGDDASATRVKLMQVQGAKKPAAKSNNRYIHSQLGYSYLTIHVADMNAALARLKKAGVKPIAKSPVAIPADVADGMFLTLIRDPDGNFIELVGPKK